MAWRGGVSGAVFAWARGIGPGLCDGPSRSGLPRKLDLWDLCPLTKGETGTFHRLASSGNSSSESWYSSSSSCMVFLWGCQEDLRDGTPREDAGAWGMGRSPARLWDDMEPEARVRRTGGEDERVLMLWEAKRPSGLVNPRLREGCWGPL